MNQRIDQLWGQALDAAVPETYTNLSYSQVLKIKHVFAELIVRECKMLNPIPSHPLFAAPDSIHELLDEIRSLPDDSERGTAMLFACMMMNACSKAVGEELERAGLTETI